jgi:hypothetical protein
MVRTHRSGEAVFRSILPEDIDWKPFAAFPPSVRLAVLVGQPSEPGPYVIRVKAPAGVKLMPHRHPEDRIYTVMSGVFYIGLGDRFDGDKVKAYPPVHGSQRRSASPKSLIPVALVMLRRSTLLRSSCAVLRFSCCGSRAVGPPRYET